MHWFKRLLGLLLSVVLVLTTLFTNVVICDDINCEIGVYGFVNRCYRIALGREPEESGINGWVNKLNSGETCGVSVAYGFVYSSEFQNAGYDNPTYVDKMYNMLLGREPDKDGKEYWVRNLNNGSNRYDIFIGFANSEEFYNLCDSYGIYAGFYIAGSDMSRVASINSFVDRLYTICLGRKGDQGGQSVWVNDLATGRISGKVAAYGFIFSNEYTELKTSNSEYVTMLYNVFFGRKPDTEGFNSWVDKLNKGEIAREDALMGFADSAEFCNLCVSYGINVGAEKYEGLTFTPEEITEVTNTPTASTTVTPTNTQVPTSTSTPMPTSTAKETPDFSVPYECNGKTYKVKSYQIDIDHEFLELFHEAFITKGKFTYDGYEYDLSDTYDSDYGLPIDLDCDGTVYGFFLDDVSNELNTRINKYRAENGWEQYAVIDYELCRLRAIEGTVGGFELGHYSTNRIGAGAASGSQNMAWAWNVEDADYFWNQYYNSPGHLAKWKSKSTWNLCNATFMRVEWVSDPTMEYGGYWNPICSCNDEMFIPSSAFLHYWGTYEVYTGMDSLLHDEDFDADYNYFITQGNAVNNYDMYTHLKWEDI